MKGGIKMDQDAEVFTESEKKEFLGEIFFPEGTKSVTVVTPEADYVFTLIKVIKK